MEPAESGKSRQHHPNQCELDPRPGTLGKSLIASPFGEAGETDRLAVEDGGRGPTVSPIVRPGEGAQPGMDGLADIVAGPRPGMTEDGALRREVLGEVGPLAPGLESVKNRVHETEEAGEGTSHGRKPPSPRSPRHPETALFSVSSI